MEILSGLWEGQRCRRVLTGVLSREEEAENICLGDLSKLFGDNINIMADEQDLERKAVEELLREAARARIRAETIGPAGWARCPLRSTNKRFLLNTLRKTTLQQRTERAGSSRDGRQTAEPWFRRPQRVWASDDTRSRSPVKTQATRRTLSPKNSHVQTHHNDRHRHIHRPTITAHTPTNRLTNHNNKCTDRSTTMTDTHRQVRVTNKHTHSATKQAPSSSHK